MRKPAPLRRRAERRGRSAESWCALLIRLAGYRVVASRLKTPVGELDLVARRGGVLVVIEVKARDSWQAAGEALTSRQHRRIERATEWLQSAEPSLAPLTVRFDVMLVRPWRWPRRLIGAWRVGE